jgi:hypothetical protein
MDALAAVLMPGFRNSDWTDQEIGTALGRGVLVVPLIHGQNPYGFIAKYQGLKTDGKNVSQVANELYKILANSPRTRAKMITCIIDTALQSLDEKQALKKLNHLDEIKTIPVAYIERLKEGAKISPVFKEGLALKFLNEMLHRRGFSKVSDSKYEEISLDDIPF